MDRLVDNLNVVFDNINEICGVKRGLTAEPNAIVVKGRTVHCVYDGWMNANIEVTPGLLRALGGLVSRHKDNPDGLYSVACQVVLDNSIF